MLSYNWSSSRKRWQRGEVGGVGGEGRRAGYTFCCRCQHALHSALASVDYSDTFCLPYNCSNIAVNVFTFYFLSPLSSFFFLFFFPHIYLYLNFIHNLLQILRAVIKFVCLLLKAIIKQDEESRRRGSSRGGGVGGQHVL